MEEETTVNTTPTNTPSGNSTMMFVVGAIVLAVVLGYVIFSSTSKTETTTSEKPAITEQPTIETTPQTQAPTDTTDMNTATSTPDDPAQMQMEMDMNANTTTDADTKVFQIEAGYPYYKPNVITVKKGDKVRVVLNSVDMMHNFNIDDLGITIPTTKSGESNQVDFVADTAGSFEFYCSIGNHRQAGQVGTLVVEE